MAKPKQKGPSLSALAALTTLAIALWMEVDLSTALFRSVLVYLSFSLILLAYRVVLEKYLAASQASAERELLEKIQREVEEEERLQKEQQEKTAAQLNTAKPASAQNKGVKNKPQPEKSNA
ncbi:hypothetical protein KKA00_05545 [bacterium]|nr:hypothetical protein [bacterium]MBU1651661.1 hypothetical protein [bacterium]MBU1881216.1 hypothetical protein [bacterium]